MERNAGYINHNYRIFTMQKILFITNRNVLTTSGELRLIKNRAESLYNDYNIPTDFIVFGSKKRINSPKRELIHAGGDTEIIPFSFRNTMSYVIGKGEAYKKIENALTKNKYAAVVLSGIGMACITRRIKALGIPVYIDLHGAMEDSLELSRSKGFVGKIKYTSLFYIDKFVSKKYIKKANGCLAVTKALQEYATKRFSLSENVSFHVVPCAIKASDSFHLERNTFRKKYREKYNITGNELVFVYSGGVSPWQCVEETISLYKEIRKHLSKPSRMLLFSHNYEYLETLTRGSDRFIIDSYTPDELKKALCAADFAFMLRKNTPTNNVAFPNKFLEYVECGLQIITTPHVVEIYNQVTNFKIGIVINDLNDYATIVERSKSINAYSDAVVQEVLAHNSFKNCLLSFVNEIS